MALTSKRAPTELHLFIRSQARAFVGDGYDNLALLKTSRHGDRRSGRRVFGGVIENLLERLFYERGIHFEQRKIGREIEMDGVMSQPASLLTDGRVHNVHRISPFQSRPDTVRGDSGRIEEIVNVCVQLAGLVVNCLDEGVRSGVV